MKLEYKILWFEDQPHNVSGAADGLRDRLSRMGFKLSIEWVENVGDVGSFIAQLRQKDDFDLVLMDWNLGENRENGAILAKRVRSNTHTEIVFYSSATPKELRKAIYEQDIDGVYCTRRDNLTAEAMAVINTTVKKVLDLNHMRGLVMATVSDFDNLIDECIRLRYCQLGEEGKLELLNHIRGKIISVCNSNAKQVEKLEEKNSIEELTEHRAFSSSLKYQVLSSLLGKKAEDRTIRALLATLGKYDNEVIDPRNALAHARPVEQGGKITFKGRSIEFDDEAFRKLRQDLLAHGDALNDIKDAIDSGILND
ncbi:response regulator [Burkholderiaceae bacterium DAT-1]|nr:response regulator [Burkholderiaceae bacterium DAT-1]